MINKKDIISTSLSVFTGSYALTNIYNVLSIIILVLSIANILWNLGCSIINRTKKKEYDKVDDDFEDSIEKLIDLKKEEKK